MLLDFVDTQILCFLQIALIFPGPNSVSVKDIAFHLQKYTKKGVCARDDDCFREPLLKQAKIEPEEEKNPHECISSSRSEGTRLKKIIFIDSTWNQTNKIITDERLQGKKIQVDTEMLLLQKCHGLGSVSCAVVTWTFP